MNGNQVIQYGPPWFAAATARRQSKAADTANSLTLTGVWLLLIGATIVFSGIGALRAPIGGLRLQPFMIPIGLTFPFVVLTRIAKFPVGPLIGWSVFGVMYAMSSFAPATPMLDPISENVKILSAIAAIITVALLVRSRTDFIFGVAGFCAAMAALAARGLEDETVGEKLIDVANKNSYSLYALPAVLLAFYIALRFDWKQVAFRRRWLWLPTLACAALAGYAILTGSNRSGYLGLAFIVFELFVYALISPRFKIVGRASAWLLISAVTAAVIGLLIWRQATQAFERRFEQTEEGTQSDRLRWDLTITSVRIGLENPVSGVTPQQLPYELGRRLGTKYQDASAVIETHNVFAHLIGGTGFICTAALLAITAALWFWRPKVRPGMQLGPGFYDARNLLRMMLCLWAVRGLFTREILYNPGFCFGIGLAIGLCIIEAEASLESLSPDSSGSPQRMLQPMLQRG
jgi:O-Antigen ligase